MREVEDNILMEIRSFLSVCDPQYLDISAKIDFFAIVYASLHE